MRIDLSPLFPVNGKKAEYQVSFEEKELGGYEVTASPQFPLTVTHETEKKISISGEGSITLSIPCSRCLKPVHVSVDFKIDSLLDAGSQTDEDGDPVFCFEEEILLPDVLIQEEVIMNIPMKVLCREDCKGICQRCGADLNLGKCQCESVSPPTKMAEALQKAFMDAKNKK